MIEVYYAEDDEIIAESVKEYLEQQNCKVTIFVGLEYAGRPRKRIVPLDSR